MLLTTKKIVFMGTPHFASEILEDLIAKGVKIDCVFTQPDRPVGRKQKLAITPVKKTALKHQIETVQYQQLDQTAVTFLTKKKPDLIVVAAYGIILPKKILAIPPLGCINIHASLLPQLRGSSPIHYALKQGLDTTGISIMLMDEGVDTGAVFFKKTVKVTRADKYLELENKLIKASHQILVPTLEKIVKGEIKPLAQNSQKASTTRMIQKQAGRIDWKNQDAKDIFNLYRAFHIWPKTYAFFNDITTKRKVVLTFRDYVTKNYSDHIGQVLKDNNNFLVQTKQGALLLATVQLEGKKEVVIEDFINGKPNFIKTILK